MYSTGVIAAHNSLVSHSICLNRNEQLINTGKAITSWMSIILKKMGKAEQT